MLIKEGMTLKFRTCDEIQINLNGNLKRINPHDEFLTILKIYKNGRVDLWNLSLGRFYYSTTISKLDLDIKCGRYEVIKEDYQGDIFGNFEKVKIISLRKKLDKKYQYKLKKGRFKVVKK